MLLLCTNFPNINRKWPSLAQCVALCIALCDALCDALCVALCDALCVALCDALCVAEIDVSKLSITPCSSARSGCGTRAPSPNQALM